MQKYFWAFCLFLLCVTQGGCQNGGKNLENAKDMATKSYAGTTNAPEFPDAPWLNTQRPLRLQDLKGKMVLLDFWTYCCINCIHILPDLKKLEREFPELIVIGVHSAKFDNEKEADNVRQAVLRYDIEHPVIVDSEFILWRQYGISAWPSFALLDPNGKYVGQTSGEGIYDKLKPTLIGMRDEFARAGKIDKEPRIFALEREKRAGGYLSYPGKLTVDKAGGRIFFSDSNHNRVICIDEKGVILTVIGSGVEGRKDGNFAESSFFRPQGLVYEAATDVLYVADTENHLIRKIDLKTKIVSTIAGTGAQAREYLKKGRGTNLALNSPWDLELLNGTLYIAMAGPHQLWQMNLKTDELEVFAGSGRENIVDGPRLAAALAQPSGISTDGKVLYFADSEVSALRYADMSQVKTLIGEGLFDFGDKDGTFPTARLQHAIGCHFYDGKVYIADTYNHKIKVYDNATKSLSTIVGTGKRGLKDGSAHNAELNEPNDVAFLNGKMYITDTNNDVLRVYDPIKQNVTTLAIAFDDKTSMLEVFKKKSKDDYVPFFGEKVTLPAFALNKDALTLKLHIPAGYEINHEAPNFVETADGRKAVLARENDRTLTARLPLAGSFNGADNIILRAGVYFCETELKARCLIKFYEFNVPLGGVSKNADKDGVLEYTISAAR